MSVMPSRSITIRPAVRADSPDIEAIDRDSFGPEDQYEPSFYDAMWTDPAFAAYVACLRPGEIAGYVLLDTGCTPMHVYSIAVAPHRRRRGVGTQLMRFAESVAGPALTLWVRPSNRAAIRLYSNLGYEIVRNARGGEGQLVMRMRR